MIKLDGGRILWHGGLEMRVQGKEFKDGTIIISADYQTPDRAGAGDYFEVIDIYIEYPTGGFDSILQSLSIDQGKFYANEKEVLKDLEVDSNEVDYQLEIERGVDD